MIWGLGRADKGENLCIVPSCVLYFLLWEKTVRKGLTQLLSAVLEVIVSAPPA